MAFSPLSSSSCRSLAILRPLNCTDCADSIGRMLAARYGLMLGTIRTSSTHRKRSMHMEDAELRNQQDTKSDAENIHAMYRSDAIPMKRNASHSSPESFTFEESSI